MATLRRPVPARAAPVLGLLALAGLGLLMGMASAILPAWFVLSVLLVPAVGVLLFIRPEYALTACAAFVCGLIHPAFVPRIPVFGGALAAADFALAMLTAYAILALATGSPRARGEPPVAGARFLAVVLAMYGGALIFAVVNSLVLLHLNPTFVLGQTRGLLYLLLLPAAVVILRSPLRQDRFVVSLVVLGCLFSVGQVMQGIFNVPVFGDQGISALETLGREDSATNRSNTLGLNVIILALLLTVGAYCVGRMGRLRFFCVAGLLTTGIGLTFGRTTFAVLIVCLAILVAWLNPRKLAPLALTLVIAVATVSVLGMTFRPGSFESIWFRMTSIGEEIDHGYSAQWRLWEFQAMWPHIQEHPFAGIGLGADYKGLSGSSARPELNRYMHNAYFYMAGKMGVPALLLFLLAMLAIFWIGRRTAKRHALPWSRMVGAAGAVMMIRFFLASVTEPHLMSDYGVVVIALCGALVYLSARRSASAFAQEPRHAPDPALKTPVPSRLPRARAVGGTTP